MQWMPGSLFRPPTCCDRSLRAADRHLSRARALRKRCPQLAAREASGKKRPSRQAQVVPITKPVRERDRNHLRFVASQSCLVCGGSPADAHHLRFAEQRAMGRKVSDRFTVPVCRLHHRELHRRGDERIWWEKQGIDPLPVAARLWQTTHTGDLVASELAGDIDGPMVSGRPVKGSGSGRLI